MADEAHSAEDRALVPVPPLPKAVATILIMAATILVVLDQTIATVALPHMQAALGATPDTINWVLTSYILATAVGVPMTGWLTGRFGRKRLFGVCIMGFTISSAVCGLSISLPMMVAARLAQGFFGAFLMPMAQAFLYDMNRPSQQVRAITMWGVGVMVGPLVGPVLGGYLTEALNWRWVFFVNVPIGLVAAVGIFATLPEFPSVRRVFDHIGFVMIAVALCALQLALDRGTQQDWFESPEIIIELGLSVAAFWMLFFHLRRSPHPIIAISLFQNRTFTVGMLLTMTIIPIVMASTALMPSLLQVLLGYPVAYAGWMVIPRGLSMTVGMIIGGRLMRSLDGRLQIGVGVFLVAASMWLQAGFDLDMDAGPIIWSGVLQGLGAGLAMTVINFTVISGAPPELRTEAAAMFSLFRNVGASLMIAVFSALLARSFQINHAEVGSAISSTNPAFFLAQAAGGLYLTERMAAALDVEVTRQAMMIAYINDFWLMMWTLLLLLPFLLILKPMRPAGNKDAEMMMAD